MATCAITKKRTRSGNNVSHSNRKTKRQFFPNLTKKIVFWGGRLQKLTVSTTAIRTQSKDEKGIKKYILENGLKIKSA